MKRLKIDPTKKKIQLPAGTLIQFKSRYGVSYSLLLKNCCFKKEASDNCSLVQNYYNRRVHYYDVKFKIIVKNDDFDISSDARNCKIWIPNDTNS